MSVEERVEGVEELLLRTLLAGEELHVVDQEHVRLAVALAELHQRRVLNSVDEVVRELLAGDIEHPRALLLTCDVVADRLHEVGLAEADTAVNEEGIVGFAGLVGYRE